LNSSKHIFKYHGLQDGSKLVVMIKSERCYRFAAQKIQMHNMFHRVYTLRSYCMWVACFALLQCAHAQGLSIPAFYDVSGIKLSNTNGNWVTVNPQQPNNIDLIETQLFKMPGRGMGVVGVEFKLFGADGGTARFKSGAINNFAEGGKGAQLYYQVDLSNLNIWNRPFLVTFGKKGESRTYDKYLYCSAGGGGSTGMAWLSPNTNSASLHKTWRSLFWGGNKIAAAAGGGGGFATNANVSNGKAAMGLERSNTTLVDYSYDFDFEKLTDGSGAELMKVGAGGSRMRTDAAVLNDPVCCDNFDKMRKAGSYVHNVFNFTRSVALGVSNKILQSVTFGQSGGVSTFTFPETNGSPAGGYFSPTSNFSITNDGGRGGAGFSGGGAGVPNTDFYTYALSYTSGLTSGGGGTGSLQQITATAHYSGAGNSGGNGGLSALSDYLVNTSIVNGGSTATPKSGYFMYRTIADTTPPVVSIDTVTIYIPQSTFGVLYSSAQLSRATIVDDCSDNDSVNTITFSKAKFTCSDVGTTQPVTVTVADFAGNQTIKTIMVVVKDTSHPIAIPIIPPNPFLPNYKDPFTIDVTKEPYTVTAADLPEGYDGCNGGVVIHFTPTTFTCAHAGTSQTVSFYYTDSDGNSSSVGTVTFNIIAQSYPVLYVDASATGNNDGSSWSNAFKNLQDALKPGCEADRAIYIAQGTYYPDRGNNVTTGNRNASFVIPENYKLYGGFPSGGDVFNNRKPATFATVLSGEIGNIASTNDNSYHIVTINSNNTLLDGFVLSDGNASAGLGSGGGAVFFQQPSIGTAAYTNTFRNCTFKNNMGTSGSAVYAQHQNTNNANSIDFVNCMFSKNTASSKGGAVYVESTSSNANQNFTNCVFTQNTGDIGGAVYASTSFSKLNLTNCTFTRNKATTSGGALFNQGAATIRNSIFYADSSNNVLNEVTNTGVLNTAFSNIHGSGGSANWNTSFGNNLGNNIDTNPQFNLINLSLNPSSPCRNRGEKAYNTEPIDINQGIRVVQDTIDMGAYECSPLVYVAWDAPNGGNGQSWATAYNSLQDGLDDAFFSSGFLKDVWVKEGTYYPSRDLNGNSNGRFNTFYVKGSNAVYGGFAGNETQLSQRNIPAHPTILSGDLGTKNDKSDNAYHVVTFNSASPRLDGLIIEGGNADHPSNYTYKGGGGIYELNSFVAESHPVINGCVIRDNSASSNGGGVMISSNLANCTMDFIQCIFYNNTALRGGAIYIQKGGSNNIDVKARLYNCTGVNNVGYAFNAPGFGEAYVVPPVVGSAVLELNNNLLLNNTTANGSVLNVGGTVIGSNNYMGTNNNDLVDITNPVGADGLIMTADDGFALQSGSSAINYGNNTLIPAEVKSDITGEERIKQLQVDAGAYESFGCLNATKLYVDAEVDTLNGNGLTWATAFRYLNDALKMANLCSSVDSILIAKGTYYTSGDVNSTADQSIAFEISRPVKIYGGYPNGGGTRDVAANTVVLSGAINTPARTDNSNHIMRVAAGVSDTTLIDGITFTNGYASVVGSYTFNGKLFRRTQGSALYSINSLVHVNNCRFVYNYAAGSGGAVYINSGKFISEHSVYDMNTSYQGGSAVSADMATDTLRLVGNVFVRDTSVNSVGGAVSSTFLSTTSFTDISNNLFAFNSAKGQGGALYVATGLFNVSNNTFFSNSSNANGGGVSVQANPNAASLLANNIFWRNNATYGDSSFLCSDFNTITGNAESINPQFSNAANPLGPDGLWFTADDGLKLKPTSQLINSGDNTVVKYSKDIIGSTRIQHGKVDPGAYESEAVVTHWYVSAAQDSIEPDGTSWAKAFPKFQDGVNAAKPGDSVWVAQGIYTPDSSGTSFNLKNKVKVFGGFKAVESLLAQRSLSDGYNSVLKGNNAAVVKNDSTDNSTLLDGFVIKNGNTSRNGGGLRNTASAAVFNHLVFQDNQAANGGAVANVKSSCKFYNTVFVGNQSSSSGAAIYDSSAVIDMRQITCYNNTAANGALIANVANSNFSISNSVLWNNTSAELFNQSSTATVAYTMAESEQTGQGNILGINPKFNNEHAPEGFDGRWFTADDGLTATYYSAFVNNGSNALATAITTDVSGLNRLQNGTVDMGAYESAELTFCDSMAQYNKSVLYVNANVPGSGDGASWATAFKTLNEALDIANYCSSIDSILVAGGTYYPTGYKEGEDRKLSFRMLRNNIHLLGGFSGNDSVARDLGVFNTILSGNINDGSVNTDNSFHVLSFKNVGAACSIDGVIIVDGKADSTIAPFNQGGGLYNVASGAGNNSSPTISNCVFSNNSARIGGAVINSASTQGAARPSFVNCVFAENNALLDGGAVYTSVSGGSNATAMFTNSTFAGNSAGAKGGAVYNLGTGGTNNTTFKNCIVWGNTAGSGVANTKQVTNENAMARSSFSLFQGGLPALLIDSGNNLYQIPLLVDSIHPKGFDQQWMTFDDGFALKSGSPAIKTGTASGAPALAITGAARGSMPDRGAYQNSCTAVNFTQNIQQAACDSVVSPSRKYSWFTSGTYFDTLYSAIGCDTFLTIHLTLNHTSVTNLTATACGSYVSPSGQFVWDTSGLYYDTLQAVSGCDSIFIVQLTIDTLPQPVVVQNGTILTTQAFASYQWLLNNVAITGATSQSYTALQNGDYSVVVTNASGCSDTSAAVNIIGLSVFDFEGGAQVALYPNPNNGNFTLMFSNSELHEVYATDMQGRIVIPTEMLSGSKQFSLEHLSDAVYFLHIKQQSGIKTIRFVVAR